VEIEIPDTAPRTGPLWLIAQGWIHPTDSSINVALGQGTHERPRGLTLEVADAAGRFRTARADLGFPAGKTKTVLTDLGRIRNGGHSARLSTSMESSGTARMGGRPPGCRHHAAAHCAGLGGVALSWVLDNRTARSELA
jgi:hypothetical protein